MQEEMSREVKNFNDNTNLLVGITREDDEALQEDLKRENDQPK